MSRPLFLSALVAPLVLAACGSARNDRGTTTAHPRHAHHQPTAMHRQSSSIADKALSDGEIAAILAAVNAGEVQQANLALQNGTGAVHQFAQRMRTDHSTAQRDQEALLAQQGIRIEESTFSRQLTANGQRTLERLSQLRGAEFDLAYMKAQFAQHEKVGAIVTEISEFARDPRYRQFLARIDESVDQHLGHARNLERGTFAAVATAEQQEPTASLSTTEEANRDQAVGLAEMPAP